MSSPRRPSLLLGALAVLAAAPATAQEARRPGAAAPEAGAAGAPAAPAVDPATARERSRADLVRAYEKEYAFLANEEAALQARLAELGEDAARRQGEAGAAVASLEARLRELEASLEAERARLLALEEEDAALTDGLGGLAAVVAQARVAGFAPPAPAQPASTAEGDEGPDPRAEAARRVGQAREALGRALSSLGQRARLRRESGRFFLADGREVAGEVVRIGDVAALGVAGERAGALAPAGGGRLQLWSAEGAAEARAAAEGEAPALLPLYLYESLERPAERRAERSVAELIEKGGVIAYVIVGLGALAGLLLLVRVAILAGASGAPDRLLEAALPLAQRGRLDDAAALCAGRRSAAARVLAAALPHVRGTPERLESAASERVLQETLRIERFGAAVLVAAAVAPLLGLLGTVTGMISTFDVITVFGTGDPKLLSGGISEALITTQLGLTVAIPALLLGNLLSGWADRIRSAMERAALRVALLAEELRPPARTSLSSRLASGTMTQSDADLVVVEAVGEEDEVDAEAHAT